MLKGTVNGGALCERVCERERVCVRECVCVRVRRGKEREKFVRARCVKERRYVEGKCEWREV